METRQQYIARQLVAEYAANGASLQWHMLNEAFCYPEVHCTENKQDIGWYCLNPRDEDQPACDECMETMQSEREPEYSQPDRYESRRMHSDYMRATWPVGF